MVLQNNDNEAESYIAKNKKQLKKLYERERAKNEPMSAYWCFLFRYSESHLSAYASDEKKSVMKPKLLAELKQKNQEFKEATAKIDRLESLEKLTLCASQFEAWFLKQLPFWNEPRKLEEIKAYLIQRTAMKSFLQNRDAFLAQIENNKKALASLNVEIREIMSKILACKPNDSYWSFPYIALVVYLGNCDDDGLADWNEVIDDAVRVVQELQK